MQYEKFYIPSTIENNKVLGFESDEILLFVLLLFTGMFFESLLITAGGCFLAYKYKKFKAGKYHFLANFTYKRLYDLAQLHHMPRPSIKAIYG